MNIGGQIEICRKYKAEYQPLDLGLKLGVSNSFFSGVLQLNGLRHPQERGTCGWYLWAGEEISEAEDFFKPMHVYHLAERCPGVVKYLALPAGWRFLVAGDYEDAWFDAELLEV
jgi:hypothetical protein